MFGDTNALTGPWNFFHPWTAADITTTEYARLEPEAWREALLDTIESMAWTGIGERRRLIDALNEADFSTRFRDMRLYTPFHKENLLAKRGIKRKLVILPFDETVRRRCPASLLDTVTCTTHKSEYFGEREDLALMTPRDACRFMMRMHHHPRD